MTHVFYVNDNKQEYCSLPDPTRSQQISIVGYLLIEGPFDGTGFTGYPEVDELEEEIDEAIERERQSEVRSFLRYTREQPGYIKRKFEDEYGYRPSPRSERFREFCAEQSHSRRRDEDGEWVREAFLSLAGSHLTFEEYFDYFGRWAGDNVRLVLDTDEIDGYEQITDDVVHEMHQTLPDEFLANGEYVLAPDMMLTVSDDDGGGDGDEPKTNDSGSNERTLFNTE